MKNLVRALVEQRNVIHAVLLRDVQTRFGARKINYIIAVCWPLAHIALLLFIYTITGRTSPMGQSAILFFATGLTPYMFFQYPSRFMMFAVIHNRPLLAFPIIRLIDLLIARAVLETVTGFGVILVTFCVLYLIGEDVFPEDPGAALAALSCMWVMAVGWGFLNCLLAAVIQFWIIFTLLFQILLYMSSGIIFVPTIMNDRIQSYLAWNPVTQGVAWFRTAYYPEAVSEFMPDRVYPFVIGGILVTVSLFLERFYFRKRVGVA